MLIVNNHYVFTLYFQRLKGNNKSGDPNQALVVQKPVSLTLQG